MNDKFYDTLYYKDDLVNEEKQRNLIESYKKAIDICFGIKLLERMDFLPIGGMYISQSALEKEKYDLVIEEIRQGRMNIPIVAEEFFDEDGFTRVFIDGHVRARARYDLGQRYADFTVLYSDIKYPSNMLKAAVNLGLKKIYQAPLYYHRIRQDKLIK